MTLTTTIKKYENAIYLRIADVLILDSIATIEKNRAPKRSYCKRVEQDNSSNVELRRKPKSNSIEQMCYRSKKGST